MINYKRALVLAKKKSPTKKTRQLLREVGAPERAVRRGHRGLPASVKHELMSAEEDFKVKLEKAITSDDLISVYKDGITQTEDLTERRLHADSVAKLKGLMDSGLGSQGDIHINIGVVSR